MTMTREEAIERFDAYLDDELNATDRAAFETSLATDPTLQTEFDAYRQTSQLFQAVPMPTPSDRLIEATQQRIHRRQRLRELRNDGALRYRMEIALCAVLVIALVAIGGLSMFSPVPAPSVVPTKVNTATLNRLPDDHRSQIEALGTVVETRTGPTNTLYLVLEVSPESVATLRDAMNDHAQWEIEKETTTEKGALHVTVRYKPTDVGPTSP